MIEYHEISDILPTGSVLVSETPATNLLPPVDLSCNYKTLWINRFTHDLPSDEIIDRLLLYANIYNWPKKKVIQFLSPGKLGGEWDYQRAQSRVREPAGQLGGDGVRTRARPDLEPGYN